MYDVIIVQLMKKLNSTATNKCYSSAAATLNSSNKILPQLIPQMIKNCIKLKIREEDPEVYIV